MLDVKLSSNEQYIGRPAPIANFPMLLSSSGIPHTNYQLVD